MESVTTKVTIIGTGNYGIALGKRFMKYGFNVIYGSRSPNLKYLNECFNEDPFTVNKFNVTTIGDAFLKSDQFVFLAVSPEDYDSLIYQLNESNFKSTKELILVELSNSNLVNLNKSNAERLNNSIKSKYSNISIIKGFNLIDAYSIGLVLDQKGSNELVVPICGDDVKSKELLCRLCNKINIKINDIGKLEYNALYLEQLNKETFSDWQAPSWICILFVLFNFIWIYIHYYIFPKKPFESFSKYVEQSTLIAHLNKVLGYSALQLLAFVYFNSIIASIYQLAYKTKYKRFPKYLDFILKSRKQFGLWAFLLASLHVICTIFITNPAYLTDWYQKVKPNSSETPKFTFHSEINLLTGIFSYILMLLVALSSINSIANSLNWNEWRFVQTKLGLACLFVAMSHTLVMYLNTYFRRHIENFDNVYLTTRVKLLAGLFPALTLTLRFVFSNFPPISSRIESIRKGKTTACGKQKEK